MRHRTINVPPSALSRPVLQLHIKTYKRYRGVIKPIIFFLYRKLKKKKTRIAVIVKKYIRLL